MTNVELIEKVLSSNLLIPEMTYAPPNGASSDEFSMLNKSLPRPLSQPHRDILKRWDGLNLDVIRLYSASPTQGRLRGLTDNQEVTLASRNGYIVFGDDPAGFTYAEDSEGKVWVYDCECNTVNLIAQSIDDFFQNYLFGLNGAAFGGDSWAEELKAAGLI